MATSSVQRSERRGLCVPPAQSMCVEAGNPAPGGWDSHGEESSKEGVLWRTGARVVLGQEQMAFVGKVLDKNQSLLGHTVGERV